MIDRYGAHGTEAETEPGSGGQVLCNLLGITSALEMERCESKALIVTAQRLIDDTDLEQVFTADDVCQMHRSWLGNIYAWAGSYRNVNIAKGEFMFASAAQVPRLMQGFEQDVLRQFTPCRFSTTAEQARALAIVHAEFILIHPFREGNGRCSRLLAMLMGLQAGLPPLDFDSIQSTGKRAYIEAIHAALDRDYAPMTATFSRIVNQTVKRQING
jgi:cell filamentation protein